MPTGENAAPELKNAARTGYLPDGRPALMPSAETAGETEKMDGNTRYNLGISLLSETPGGEATQIAFFTSPSSFQPFQPGDKYVHQHDPPLVYEVRYSAHTIIEKDGGLVMATVVYVSEISADVFPSEL